MECSVSVAKPNLDPVDGMKFDSHEAAYEYYKEYAKGVGFGTAKLSSRRSRASKEFIDAKFTCIRYGNKQQSDDAINPRPSPKIGCKASMHVKRRQDAKWYVHSFVKEHNHELLPDQVHFFRSHRNADKNEARVGKRKTVAGTLRPHRGYQFSGGTLEIFLRNQNDRGRSLSLEEGGAQMLLELFAHMQEEDLRFFYAVDFNEEHRLRNVFWVDSKAVDEYAYFGDVVSFDTLYFTSKYAIPLVLFVGVNHHVQPVLLGSALIADDTVHTFAWLMQTWCLAMGGRRPRVLLTDQNRAIKTAVTTIFPNTRHCYTLWSILQKFPGQLDYVSQWYETFMKKFNKYIHTSLTEEQFETRWQKLVDRFNLREVDWIQSLYEDRKLWVPAFMRDVSFAGLSSASRTGSLQGFFDRYIQSDTTLGDFIVEYKVILEDMHEEEAKANFDSWHETAELKSPSPFEKQMSLVYTHEIFKKFQDEVLGAAACHLKKEKEQEATIIYAVKDIENNQDFVVEWNEQKSDIYCSCHLFEYNGYLCRHAIVILQMSGVFNLPFKYMLQRWTNAATSKHPICERLDEVQSKVRRFNDLCRRAIILGEEGSLSQDSYNVAIGALREALRHCADINNSTDDVKPNASGTCAIQGVEKASTRAVSLKEKANTDNNASNKGKVPMEREIPNVRMQSVFPQMVRTTFSSGSQFIVFTTQLWYYLGYLTFKLVCRLMLL
ncbi:hypothetical protein Leryth_026789 [Lithospermum erythrorhizon]|nr:hypothetical protein Leryth_026789 [Lithospermum erythrorhizon]